MRRQLIDRKSKLTVAFFYLVNKIVSRNHFKSMHIVGAENIPKSGSFLLIANHTSRWDGPVLMETMGRAANWMVSPNELLGLQGLLLRSVGAFPADRRCELMQYVGGQIKKGEPVVIFPEGNVFRDGTTHAFKSGASRVILMAKEMGIDLPIVSAAIHYCDAQTVKVVVAKPVWVEKAFLENADRHETMRCLTNDLHRKVSNERVRLESAGKPSSMAEHVASHAPVEAMEMVAS